MVTCIQIRFIIEKYFVLNINKLNNHLQKVNPRSMFNIISYHCGETLSHLTIIIHNIIFQISTILSSTEPFIIQISYNIHAPNYGNTPELHNQKYRFREIIYMYVYNCGVMHINNIT